MITCARGVPVEYLRYERGKFLNALRRKAAEQNENNCIGRCGSRPKSIKCDRCTKRSSG